MSTDLPTYVETFDLEEPFYLGSGVSEPEETAFPCALEGVGFLLDFSRARSLYDRFQCSPINLTNTQQATNAGDQSQTAPEVWRRFTETWDGGSGQLRIDRENSDPARFNDSYRVDVWAPWHASLLPDVDLVEPLGGGPAFLHVVAGTWLVALTGVDAFWMTDLSGGSTTHVVMSGPALAATTDGQRLYVLEDSGVVRVWANPTDPPTILADLSGYGPTTFDPARPLLAYVAGFLVAACGPDLLDVTTGTPTRIWLHPLDTWTWRSAVDGLNGMYLLGGQGDRWNVMATTLKDDATTFNPPKLSAPLPRGEVARVLSSYLGFLLIGSDSGWHFASTDDAQRTTYGRLVTSQTPVLCFEGEDRFVWFGMDGDTTATTAGLGRADLETFVANLTPASAPDLSTPVLTGQVTAVSTFAGKRVFAVAGSGVWAQADRLAPDGWLTQGAASFSSSDTKTGLYAEVFHAPLAGAVAVDASFDDGDWVQLGNNRGPDSVSTGHLNMDARFKHLQLRYRLTRDSADDTRGPTLTRSEVRAIAVQGKAREWRLPLVVRAVEEYQGATVHMDVGRRLDLLEDLAETKRLTPLRIYSRTYSVYMADYLQLGESPTAPSTDGQELQCCWIAVVREVV